MPATLSLKRNLFLQQDGTWRLQAWTAEADGISEKVFVYRRRPAVPYDDEPLDEFVNMAQVSDLEDYPEDSPEDPHPFFRKAHADLEIRSPKIAQETIDGMARDVVTLLRDFNKLEG